MYFINIKDKKEGIDLITKKINDYLEDDKQVLWLLSGGSNIILEIEILNILEKRFGEKLKKNLAVTLMDERYGPVGYFDSNWRQLVLAGFDFNKVKSSPVLVGLEPKETVIEFGKKYRDLQNWADIVIGQFGIGQDGHIAGILPNTTAVTDEGSACFYKSEKYERVTLTLKTLKNINIAYAFVFDESKKEIIKKLQVQNLICAEMPAQVLKQIPESYLITSF